ncbi:MAG TPA: hypothetical protein VGV93_06265 [Acidimicrobiales bacterium]|nr:hypothetical protein [Acidimicrobiales bacterium]
MIVRRLLLMPVLMLTVLISSAPAATALSCVGFPDGSHLAIAAGKPPYPGDPAFFERWHHLLLGRVVGVTTDERELSPTSGRTTWTVEVAAALGEGDVPSVVGVTARDPGWLNGYAFTVGDAFAIPVWEIDELGYWASFACDPITPLDDLDGAVDAVLAVAAESGTPIAAVGDTGSSTEPDRAPAVETDRALVSGWEGGRRWAASAVVVAAVAGGGTFTLWRRRR